MKLSYAVVFTLSLTLAFIGCCKQAALKETSSGTLEGIVTPSEKMGEIEFRADGTAFLKAHNIEGKVMRAGEQIAIVTPQATYYFTWKDGEFKNGIVDPSKKILPIHPVAPIPQEGATP